MTDNIQSGGICGVNYCLTKLLVKLLHEWDKERNLCRQYFSGIIYTILENFLTFTVETVNTWHGVFFFFRFEFRGRWWHIFWGRALISELSIKYFKCSKIRTNKWWFLHIEVQLYFLLSDHDDDFDVYQSKSKISKFKCQKKLKACDVSIIN